MKFRFSPYLAALSAVVMVLAGVWVLDRLERERFRERDRAEVLNQLSNVRARLEGGLNKRLFLLRGLVAYVSTYGDIAPEEFNSHAAVILTQETGIDNIYLAKNNVVSYIYPSQEKEAAIGVKLMKLPQQREAIQRAIDTKKTVIAGPFNAFKGDLAFVSYTPIFFTEFGEPPEKLTYWGMGGIDINRDTLLQEAGMLAADSKLQYAIRTQDGLESAGEVFFGDATIFQKEPAILSVTLPNNSWQLAAIPAPGWSLTNPASKKLSMWGGALALLTGVLAFKWASEPVRLGEAVERATIASIESETKYRELVENLNSIIIEIDPQGNITFFNKLARNTFGYSENELLGKNLIKTILVSTESSEKDLQNLIEKSFKYPEKYNYQENENICKDGERVWIAWRNKALMDDRGHLIGIISIGTDISDRKRAEMSLQKANEELEIRVQERTAQITQALEELRHEIAERQMAQKALAEQVRIATFRADVDCALTHIDVQNVLQGCAEAVVQHLDAAFARIWTLNEKKNVLELQASAGIYTRIDGFYSRVNVGDLKIGAIAQTRQPHLTNSVLEAPWISDKEWAKQEGMVAFAGYPLIVEDCIVGVIAMFARQPINQSTLKALEFAAGEIAIWILRKQAQEALRQSEERWQLALNGNNDGIWDWKPKTNEVFFSRRYKEMLGYSESEFANDLHEWSSRVHPDDLSWVMDALQDHLNRKTQYYVTEYRLRCKDGTYKWILDRGQALWDESGKPARVVGSHTDITDRKQAEEALRQSEAREREKAQQLEEALVQLQRTQTQLIQTEKMSSLGQLVAGIAHEINNPVNFIYGNLTHLNNYAQNMLDLIHIYQSEYPQPAAKIEEFIEEIEWIFLEEDLSKILSSMKVGTERIRQIVLSLRNFSRLDEADMKPVDIREGIESTLLILQNRLKGHKSRPDIQVVKEYGDLPEVDCYAGQLNQVFMNILTNAIDVLEEGNKELGKGGAPSGDKGHGDWGLATGAKKILDSRSPLPNPQSQIPTIRIGTRIIENQRVTIAIADNGMGMNEDVRAKIFNPFFTTKEVGKGTGLGLSIAYQIVVEKHKGKLECFSEVGRGTTFLIEIPIRQNWTAYRH